MSRLARKNRTAKELGILSQGGFLDAIDNEVKETLRINDKEYDYLCEVATDEELSLVTNDSFTYSEKRDLIEMLNKHLKGFEV
jgi:hypothetical protein